MSSDSTNLIQSSDSKFHSSMFCSLHEIPHQLSRHYWSRPRQSTGSYNNHHNSLKITPFIALQLRVARLEQEMSEVKKTDHSADVLASIKSQVPTAVDKYLGTKLDDALLKNQESKKSPKEIIRIKKEQGEEKQDSTYSIRSTDKVDLEEFDLKSALFKHMNKIKLKITREIMIVIDDEDDDDEERPLSWIKQDKSAKRKDMDSGASGSSQPPTKDDRQ
ncbi:hypothetical protein Tco_0916637 [Tanacetum coccineum]